jgi:DNA-binding transcriptional ArsR family regulator
MLRSIAILHIQTLMTDSQRAFQIVLHAISDPTRRRILQVLKNGSSGNPAGLCASDIEMKIRLSQPTISHHMAVLQKARLVDARKEGLWRWYRRNEAALNAFTRRLRRTL